MDLGVYINIIKKNCKICKKVLDFFLIVLFNIYIFLKDTRLKWGCSSAGLERLPVTQEVEGSSPFTPATYSLNRV